MDREIFNEFDRAFQEGKQKILNNKEEELSYEYKERLQAANDSFVTRLKVISQSNYSYNDRKENDDRERQRFEAIKAELEQERQERIAEETAKDIERLDLLYFPEVGRDATLKKIQGLEKVSEMNIPNTFNERSGEKNVKGYLKDQYDEQSGFVAEEKDAPNLTNKFEISEADKNEKGALRRDFRQTNKIEQPKSSPTDEVNSDAPSEYSDYSSEDIHVDIDLEDSGYEPSNDNTPSEDFEP